MRIVSRHSFCRTRAPHVRSNALLPKEAECYQLISLGIRRPPNADLPFFSTLHVTGSQPP